MKKLAIFDFDGTLFNSVDDVMACFNQALTGNGFPALTYEEFVERLGGNIDEMVSLMLKDQNTSDNIEIVKESYGKLYADCPKEKSLPFAGVHEVLRQLQDEGILLSINSNRKNDSIKMFIERYYDDIDFLAIEGHNEDYPSKPNPCGVNKIREKLNVSRQETIYIGDSSTDIRTSQNAQIDCIIVKWGYGNHDAFESDYILGVVEKPSEILKYF